MDVSKVVRSSFVAGLALIAPLIVTVVALRFLLNWLTTFIDPVVQGTRLAQYTANIEVVAQALAAVLILLLITLLGYLAQRSLGERLFGWLDRGVGLVPLVRVIYSSVRQVSNALMEQSSRYESVVLVEYPREGVYTLGFVTGDAPDQTRDVTGGEAFNVFLPNSPNPTGGRLLLVPADQVHEVDISVRRGIRLLVTTGIAEREEEVRQLREDVEIDD
ncbi:DUF502 domain-containing protein [Halorientalis marina]|jgi:uncharacterized membrane protein|uniref:DUF502 domain-containing protein n=1 Tax=Halorientalis marina TaxID=2931976 RepID=UPI001FF55612|nr:DUF502 domain-containing protein [Halorientalis marina]